MRVYKVYVKDKKYEMKINITITYSLSIFSSKVTFSENINEAERIDMKSIVLACTSFPLSSVM